MPKRSFPPRDPPPGAAEDAAPRPGGTAPGEALIPGTGTTADTGPAAPAWDAFLPIAAPPVEPPPTEPPPAQPPPRKQLPAEPPPGPPWVEPRAGESAPPEPPPADPGASPDGTVAASHPAPPSAAAPPPSQEPEPAPGPSWRRLLHRTGAPAPPGRRSPPREDLVQRVARPFTGVHQVAVVSLKGGVGRTTATALLGLALAEHRGDRVLALDSTPVGGTLADRLLGAPDAVRPGPHRRLPARGQLARPAALHRRSPAGCTCSPRTRTWPATWP